MEMFENNTEKRVKRYIVEWYNLHNKESGVEKFDNYSDTPEEINKRAESLREFLKDKFRTDFGISDEVSAEIEKRIQEYKDADMFDGDYFEIKQGEVEGGRKRKGKRMTKKRRKSNNKVKI
jgi:hypothetical protein